MSDIRQDASALSFRRRTLFILLLAAFSAMLGMGIIAPFLPRFARQHGANGFWMGMIFAGFGFSRAVVMPFIGRLSDKVGRKIFVVSGLLLYAVISIGYPLANGIVMLTAVRLIHGLAAGMIIPIVLAYTGDISEKGKESKDPMVAEYRDFLARHGTLKICTPPDTSSFFKPAKPVVRTSTSWFFASSRARSREKVPPPPPNGGNS